MEHGERKKEAKNRIMGIDALREFRIQVLTKVLVHTYIYIHMCIYICVFVFI